MFTKSLFWLYTAFSLLFSALFVGMSIHDQPAEHDGLLTFGWALIGLAVISLIFYIMADEKRELETIHP